MAVSIPIITQFSAKGITLAIKQFKALNSATDRARFLTNRLLLPATVALSAQTVVLGKVLYDAAKAAAEDEKSQKLLASALNNSVGASEFFVGVTEQMIDKLQRATGVADTELRPAMALLARGTGDLTTSQELLNLALDISAATGKPVEEVALALTKAYQGNYKSLQALGIPLDENTKKTKDFDAVQTQLARLFGGSAAVNAQTFEGQLKRLKVAYDEIIERLGRAVLPYLQKFAEYVLNAVVPAVEQFINSLTGGRGVSGSFRDAIAAMGKFGPGAINAMQAASNAALEFVQTLALGYAGIQALIGATKALATRGKAGLAEFTTALGAAGAVAAIELLQARTNNYFNDLRANMPTLEEYHASVKGAVVPIGMTADQLERLANQTKTVIPDLDTAGAGVDRMAQKVDKLTDALRDRMNQELDKAKDNLREAQEAFDAFKSDVAGAITGVIDFGDAAQYSAERGGVTFFDALEMQAAKAKEFGGLVDRLIAAGLSREALGQVIAAGQEAGSFIAQQLLESSENILRANRLVEETSKIAQAIGNRAAEKFYQAGLVNGQAYLKGIEEAIAAAEKRLSGKGLRPADVKGIGAGFDNTLAQLNTAMPQSNMSSNVVVNVNTVTAPANLGDTIVDALRDYNRRSGPLQLQID